MVYSIPMPNTTSLEMNQMQALNPFEPQIKFLRTENHFNVDFEIYGS